jgi:hypothetical protein
VLNFASSAPGDIARTTESRRWLAPGSAAAGISLGLALQISNGTLDPAALSVVAVALTLIAGAVVLPRPAKLARLDATTVTLIAVAGLWLHLRYLYTSLPAIYLRLEEVGLAPFHWGLAILAVVCGLIVVSRERRAKPLLLGALLAAHGALGVWIIHRSPSPAIDVFVFHKDAIEALRSGVDPYTLTFPDIYTDSVYYGPGLSIAGRLQFGT